MSQAWWTVNLGNHKRLPPLDRLLPRRRGRKQTATEARSVVHQISAQLGVPIKRVRLIRKDLRGE